jgi:hypothetical protein
MTQDEYALIREIDTLKRRLEVSELMRIQESNKAERLVTILCAIHALLYPPLIRLDDGRIMQFNSPMKAEQIQELSDRIRSIPDDIIRVKEVNL